MDIWIWGTGPLAQNVYENGFGEKIRGFIETRKTKETFLGYPVISATEIAEGYDYILWPIVLQMRFMTGALRHRLICQRLFFL